MCFYYKVTTIFWMYLGEDWWAIIWTRPHQKLVDILCIHECPHTDDYNFWFSSSSSKRLRGPICLSLWVSNPNLSCYSYLTVQNKRHSNKCVYIEPIVFCQRVVVVAKKKKREENENQGDYCHRLSILHSFFFLPPKRGAIFRQTVAKPTGFISQLFKQGGWVVGAFIAFFVHF